jgi:predicted dehydrogenase
MRAASAGLAFSLVPRHVLGGAGQTPPSEKLNIAGIGVGGRGADDLSELESENIVALCDVDDARAAETYKRYPAARRYKDFRRMLDKEDKNIDAVMVATPDHTHAAASMAAIRRGKHVYCEKPLTHTIHESRQLARAAREAKVATQMGNQGQAFEGPRLLSEWIAAGAIGGVREVHVWSNRPAGMWPQGAKRPEGTPPVPAGLDWDLWLGPAPSRPYHATYVPFSWRDFWDFGTGPLGDMGSHNCAPVFEALKLGAPVSVEARSTEVFEDTLPLASIVYYRFPARGDMPPVRLVWYDGGLLPERPEELEPGRNMSTEDGIIFVGDKGKILVEGWGAQSPRLIPESRHRAYDFPAKTLPRSIGHHAEWVRACKEGTATGSNFDFASLVTEMVLLGNIAIRTGRKLTWDAPGMKFVGDDDANQYLHYEYRQGWAL